VNSHTKRNLTMAQRAAMHKSANCPVLRTAFRRYVRKAVAPITSTI